MIDGVGIISCFQASGSGLRFSSGSVLFFLLSALMNSHEQMRFSFIYQRGKANCWTLPVKIEVKRRSEGPQEKESFCVSTKQRVHTVYRTQWMG